MLSSAKDFASGSNDFVLSIKQGSKEVQATNTLVNFVMPKMSSMSKMTQKADIKISDNHIDGVLAYRMVIHGRLGHLLCRW